MLHDMYHLKISQRARPCSRGETACVRGRAVYLPVQVNPSP